MGEVTSNHNLEQAANAIETAILQSQYLSVKLVNQQQLALYYGIGKYVSENSRKGFWGKGAIEAISNKLKADFPGLRGFSATNIKLMRLFYEEWSMLDAKSSLISDDNSDEISPIEYHLLIHHSQVTNFDEDFYQAFLRIGFTLHRYILSSVKDLEARIYYIKEAARRAMNVETLRNAIASDEYHHRGTLPNNFANTIPGKQLVRKALLSFKDEYLLDYINTEEIGTREEEDVDEKVVERGIVHNIRKFIMTFGKDFSFIGNQYRIDVAGHPLFIDLLFYNRDLCALVAIELKAGKFKPAYLGQLHLYLQALDDYVRKPNENPSIGLVLCKEADRLFAEYAVRDYDKPMGVATYRTKEDMPERLRNALPDLEELKKLME